MVTSGERLQVEVLGPIRVFGSGRRDITPPGLLQRRLLAVLVLRRGRVVTADSAVDVLWPSKLPADPAAALQNHLFRLRRALPEGVIDSVGDGYRLDPATIDVDADRLAAALTAGAGADGAVLAELDAIIDRWQGPAYAELEDVDDGRAEAESLEELRFRAREMRAETRLAWGDADGTIAELTSLAGAEPLRERPRQLLMAALASTGRQVDALRVFDDFRRLLGDELGIEPSATLVAQHAELLAGADRPELAGQAPARRFPARRLPVPATSLVGRDALAGEVAALAEIERLVTLVGPGGVGKTRLLIEVGHRLLAARPDRPVVLCELAGADAGSAIDEVAAALGIDARPGSPLADRVAAVMGDSESVLLLDNCEHVLDPTAALVERLLTQCPALWVVATSRERLRVGGEQVRTVPALPSDGEGAPAVQLFVQRARAVAPGFEPDGSQLACIAEIVRRLDGLPLAIELAAARLLTHGVEEVAAGLDRGFSLLSAGYRTSSRHASLGAAVSWSFGLLDEDLRRTFAELSVFSGPFDSAAAAAICGVEPDAVTSALAQLVERSLVMRAPGRRYLLLQTLRAFGAEQLVASGRAELAGERHAHHLLDWLERADRRFTERDERGQLVLVEIDAAVPELRNAVGWLVDHDEVELAGRLIAALLDYGFLRLRPDVLAWSERVIQADAGDRSPLAAQVWVAAAYKAWMAGDVAETGVRSARALRIAERAGGPIPSEVITIRASYELFE